ncbi:MAG: glycerophosphodiester phosphodiesterase [Promethearchaeota archaeon]
MSRIYIWAHRGASGYVFENTEEAFELAIEQGANGLESDVRMSSDGVLVLFHDSKVMYQDKLKRISKLKISEIDSIELGPQKLKVPHVEDIFRKYKNRKNKYGELIKFSLDMGNPGVGLKLIDLIKDLKFEDQVELTPSSNWPFLIRILRKFREKSESIVIIDSAKPSKWKSILKWNYYQMFDKLKALNIKGINLKEDKVTPDVIRMIKERGFKLYVWDCHREEQIRKILNYIKENNEDDKIQIDAIYTNYPDLAVKMLSQK